LDAVVITTRYEIVSILGTSYETWPIEHFTKRHCVAYLC